MQIRIVRVPRLLADGQVRDAESEDPASEDPVVFFHTYLNGGIGFARGDLLARDVRCGEDSGPECVLDRRKIILLETLEVGVDHVDTITRHSLFTIAALRERY